MGKETTSGAGEATGKIAPAALYYLAIDGTQAMDSVAYGRLLETKFGWKNLVGELLDEAHDDSTRLSDPAHPFLPIWRFKAKGTKGIAVVSPGGKNGVGKDDFLRKYAGEDPGELPFGSKSWPTDPWVESYVTVGRHTAFEKCNRFMKILILNPGVEVKKEGEKIVGQLVDASLSAASGGKVFRPDLLLISSHGWLGGFMKGDLCQPWKDARPDWAQPAFVPKEPYLSVGAAAEQNLAFHGPRWIILAQCSTANSATWPLWAKLIAKSSPAVRGILAYEEVSPGPQGSIQIAESFFDQLKSSTILESWKKANSHQKWAAIVHKDAVDDRIGDWRGFKPITSTETSATSGSYLGFLPSIPGGQEILDVPPPFSIKLEVLVDLPKYNDWVEITPAVLAKTGILTPGWKYRLTIQAPSGHSVTKASVTWIHIRLSYHLQFAVSKLFAELAPADASKGDCTVRIDPANPRRILVESTTGPLDALSAIMTVKKPLSHTGMEAHHSYLWPSIDLTLDSGGQQYDFKTWGLSYYGG